MKYRMHGQIYYNEVKVEEVDGEMHVMIPKKAAREKGSIKLEEYNIVPKE